MSLQKPPPEGHDFPLDFHWKTKPSFVAAAGVGLTGHPRALEARNSIMTSLALAGRAGRGGWVSYSRSKRFYAPLSRYEGTAFTYDRILNAVDELGDLGLIEEERASPGPASHGWQSRMRATDRLMAAFEAAPIEHVGPREVLELRDAEGQRMQYLDTDRIRRLRRAVEARNEALAAVRIFMPEKDGWVHTPGHVSARSEKGERGWAHIRTTPVPQVVRIYGRGRWDMHGRLYGWWQQLPEARRAELMINDEFAFEADWSACHPTLLYAMAGKVPVGDVYQVDGYHRDHGKAALNRAINCKSLNGAVLSLLKDEHDDPGSWPYDEAYTRRLVHAVADRNSDIRQYLGSDAGIHLMHVESEMCMDVLKRCERESVPVLPVHDGFVTQDTKRVEITAIMAEVMDATCVAIKSRGASIKGKKAPQMGARGPVVAGVASSPPREAKPKLETAPRKDLPAKAVPKPVRAVEVDVAPEPIPADFDRQERVLALRERFEAAARGRHRKLSSAARTGWGEAPSYEDKKRDFAQARRMAEALAEEEADTGFRIVLNVPWRLSDEAKARRAKRLAPRPMPAWLAALRRPSATRLAKPEVTPPKGEAKPQATLL